MLDLSDLSNFYLEDDEENLSFDSSFDEVETMSIDEDKQFTANGSKMINETQIYQSKDLLDSLDLMHRLCK